MDKPQKLLAYYSKEHQFKKGIAVLRSLALKTEAAENYKWSAPVYTINGKNVFWISRFNNHFGVGFFNGIFLKDQKKLLINVQEGKTQAMRHWRFSTGDMVDEVGVLAYMKESLKNQKEGKVFVPKKKKISEIPVPDILVYALKKNTTALKEFEVLSPYKQREYAAYISDAKQEKTKRSRLEKILSMISEGVGLHDKYRN